MAWRRRCFGPGGGSEGEIPSSPHAPLLNSFSPASSSCANLPRLSDSPAPAGIPRHPRLPAFPIRPPTRFSLVCSPRRLVCPAPSAFLRRPLRRLCGRHVVRCVHSHSLELAVLPAPAPLRRNHPLPGLAPREVPLRITERAPRDVGPERHWHAGGGSCGWEGRAGASAAGSGAWEQRGRLLRTAGRAAGAGRGRRTVLLRGGPLRVTGSRRLNGELHQRGPRAASGERSRPKRASQAGGPGSSPEERQRGSFGSFHGASALFVREAHERAPDLSDRLRHERVPPNHEEQARGGPCAGRGRAVFRAALQRGRQPATDRSIRISSARKSAAGARSGHAVVPPPGGPCAPPPSIPMSWVNRTFSTLRTESLSRRRTAMVASARQASVERVSQSGLFRQAR